MWEQKSRHHLPSGTAFRKEPSVSAGLEQGQRTRGYVVWQGWACGPEWAAARDHLPLQSSGERSLPGSAGPSSHTGPGHLVPNSGKAPFCFCLTICFSCSFASCCRWAIFPFGSGGKQGANAPEALSHLPRDRPRCFSSVFLALSLSILPWILNWGAFQLFFFFFQSDKIWMRALFKAFILILL